ncbi:hypothetical protein LINPERHAP2_LOCUS22852 [Linum perenne]
MLEIEPEGAHTTPPEVLVVESDPLGWIPLTWVSRE